MTERDEMVQEIETLRAEVACLRQGLWDCFSVAGGDTDGDVTPVALTSPIVPLVLECVHDLRNCYDATNAEVRRLTSKLEAERWTTRRMKRALTSSFRELLVGDDE